MSFSVAVLWVMRAPFRGAAACRAPSAPERGLPLGDGFRLCDGWGGKIPLAARNLVHAARCVHRRVDAPEQVLPWSSAPEVLPWRFAPATGRFIGPISLLIDSRTVPLQTRDLSRLGRCVIPVAFAIAVLFSTAAATTSGDSGNRLAPPDSPGAAHGLEAHGPHGHGGHGPGDRDVPHLRRGPRDRPGPRDPRAPRDDLLLLLRRIDRYFQQHEVDGVV